MLGIAVALIVFGVVVFEFQFTEGLVLLCSGLVVGVIVLLRGLDVLPPSLAGRPYLVWTATTVLVLLLAGVVAWRYVTKHVVFQVAGEVLLVATNGEDIVKGPLFVACEGAGGYDDLRVEAAVLIRDEESRILATTELRNAKFNEISSSCSWTFGASDLPKRPFYSVEVTHRSPVTFGFAESLSDKNCSEVGGGPERTLYFCGLTIGDDN